MSPELCIYFIRIVVTEKFLLSLFLTAAIFPHLYPICHWRFNWSQDLFIADSLANSKSISKYFDIDLLFGLYAVTVAALRRIATQWKLP